MAKMYTSSSIFLRQYLDFFYLKNLKVVFILVNSGEMMKMIETY